MIRYKAFQPTKREANRFSIGGLLAVAAVEGMIVNRKAGTADTLELSTGKAGYFLSRDVKSLADIQTHVRADVLDPNKGGFQTPFQVDGSVQAEDYDEVWVEGAGLLDASMDNTVVAGANVTSATGKYALLTNSETQESLGVVSLVEPGRLPGSTGKRFCIQVRRSVKNIPAA